MESLYLGKKAAVSLHLVKKKKNITKTCIFKLFLRFYMNKTLNHMEKPFLEKQNNIAKNMYFHCFEIIIKKIKKKTLQNACKALYMKRRKDNK